MDEIAGVSRTASGGAPTQTPNVAGAPFRLNADVSTTPASNNASYASLFIHSRARGQAEVTLMYNTVKAKMASRGVTLQVNHRARPRWAGVFRDASRGSPWTLAEISVVAQFESRSATISSTLQTWSATTAATAGVVFNV